MRCPRWCARCPTASPIHPKLERQFAQRDELVAGGQVDWALAEALAIGSLMYEGVNVRLTGQDTRRGTFSHRHAVLVDYGTARSTSRWRTSGTRCTASGRTARADGRDGQLHRARLAALRVRRASGFEYGYSVEAPEALVAWEAQFGDFANGAQIIIDNFLVAAEDKWGQHSGLVLLLPHGYEGQGPEHSSVALRAVPVARRPGQHARDGPVDRGAVLPPAALPGPAATRSVRSSS